MKILEYKHQGSLDFTIVLGGNLDHAGVANDGLAGCVVGMEVMRRLQGRKTKFTYSLVLSPGIIGSELYLAGLSQAERRPDTGRNFPGDAWIGNPACGSGIAAKHGKRVACPEGQPRPDGPALPNRAVRKHHRQRRICLGELRDPDAFFFAVSLSRVPFEPMTAWRLSRKTSLNEAVEALIGAVDRLEASPIVIKKFEGNICLSNPQYDLYVDYGQVALGDSLSDHQRRMRSLMDFLPALDRPTSSRPSPTTSDCRKSRLLSTFSGGPPKG